MSLTGKERDAETGLDYFGARYMSAAQGRFTSPDAPMLAQHPSEPQSWNLYTYTANNPLSRIDPDGRNWFEINGQWQWHEGSDVNDKGEGCKRSENILRWVRDTAKNKTPGVFPTISVLVRR